MRHLDFNIKEHGFVGHLAKPDFEIDTAVIVVMGGEGGLLPGIKIAERFVDFGITGLSVSLFGAEGIPETPNLIPLEYMENAINYLREKEGIKHITIYGMSMGSIFASLAAIKVGGIDNLILVSPTHVPFEGTLDNKKTMSGHSVVTWRGEEIPFIKEDFSKVKATKYIKHPKCNHKVMGMWKAYYDAYHEEDLVNGAELKMEDTNARIFMIAGMADEAWPSAMSVRYMENNLKLANYKKDYKALYLKNVSHLTGIMPNEEREKKLFRKIPMIGLMYKSFGKYKQECMNAFKICEIEVIRFLGKN